MTDHYALLLDGAFVARRLRTRLRLPRRASTREVLDECSRIQAAPELSGLRLLRRYWYDARPATGNVRNPLDGRTTNLGRSALHAEANHLLQELELQPDFAIRLGEISVLPSWRLRPHALGELASSSRPLRPDDLRPDIQQKGVDLRIGLDMARLALQRMVSTIVVVTGDSDMIPAFKFARREGIRVLLDHLGGPVKRELRAHADGVLERAVAAG